MLLNLHHRNSKLDNFKDEKTSDHKTVSVAQRNKNNCPAYQIMSTFGGHFFFYVFLSKIFLTILKNIVASALKSCIK